MSLRSVADPAAAIQRTVRELDQQAQAVNLRTMNDVVDTSLLQERFVAQFGSFSSLFVWRKIAFLAEQFLLFESDRALMPLR